MASKVNPLWYKSFFHGIVNELWRKAVSPDQTRDEVTFLEKMLGAKTRLLDVPCGNGRHALELVRRGCRVSGVDFSPEFIDEARSAARGQRLEVEFVQANIRDLTWNTEFDGAFCFGNSFGYLEYADMISFVKGVARALKPRGTFVIETGMAAESIIPSLKEREWYQFDDIFFAIQNRYLADVSCLETEGVFVRNGLSEKRTWWHWVYTTAEIRRMLEGAGFKIINLYSSLSQQPFKLGDQRLFIVARKDS